MSFDKNHQSPERMVNVRKRTTQVNIALMVGCVVFVILGAIALWWVMRHPPQTLPSPLGK